MIKIRFFYVRTMENNKASKVIRVIRVIRIMF